MKLLKRAVAFALAVSMAVPSNITGIANVYAKETDKQSYSVSLEQPEKGNIKFTDYESDSIRLEEDEKVSIDFNPDDGYEVSEFKIIDPETDDVIVNNATSDDHFEFSMPDYDIVVTGTFEEKKNDEEDSSQKTTEDVTKEKATEAATEKDTTEKVEETTETTETPEEVVADAKATQIIVGTDDEAIFRDADKVISSFDGLWIVEYPTYDEAVNAVDYFSKKADFAEINEVLTVDEGEEEVSDNDVEELQKDEDAFTALSEILEEDESQKDSDKSKDYSDYIALIDTGINSDKVDSVSLVGDDGTDKNGHGTEMYNYIVEENPDAKIISIKAFNDNGHAQVSDVYASIKYAESLGVKYINFSASSYKTAEKSVVIDAIKESIDGGITFIGSAGNKGKSAKYFIPGVVDEALIIGSCNSDGAMQSFSNFGDTVDYYVVSDSTSEATARYTGILSGGKESDKLYEMPDITINLDSDDESENKPDEGHVLTKEEYEEALNQEDWSDYPDGEDYEINTDNGTVKEWTTSQDFDSYAGTHYGTASFSAGQAGYGTVTFSTDSPIYKTTGVQTFDADCEGHHSNNTDSKGAQTLTSGTVDYWATASVSTIDSGKKNKISWDVWIKKHGYESYYVSWSTAYGTLHGPYTFMCSTSDLGPSLFQDKVKSAVATGGYTGKLNARATGDYGTVIVHANQYTSTVEVYDIKYSYSAAGQQQTFELQMAATAPREIKLDLTKTTSDNQGSYASMVSGNPNYSLAGAKFTVNTKSDGTGTTLGTFTTDANGDADALDLTESCEDGQTVYVWETTAPPGYRKNDDVKSVTLEAGATKTVTFEDAPINDPINLMLAKEGSASTKLSGATFQLNYYAVNVNNYSSISDLSGLTPTKKWIFKTDSNGRISCRESTAESGSDAFYTVNDVRRFPLGVYTFVETSASDGYLNKGTMKFASDANSQISFENGNNGLYFEVRELNDDSGVYSQNGTLLRSTTASATNLSVTATDTPKYFGFKFRKNDADYGNNTPQGNAQNLQVTVKVINRSGYPVTLDGNPDGTSYADGAEVFRFTTDANGNYTSTNKKLQAGVYDFVEVTPPTGYLNTTKRNGITTFRFPSSATTPSTMAGIQNEQIYDFTQFANQITNPVKRGGFAVEKIDYDKQRSEQSGDCPNLVATFDLYNRSNNKVKVDTNGDGVLEEYAKNAKIMTFTSSKLASLDNKYFGYISDAYLLPYGTYEIVETAGPTGYLTQGGKGVYKKTFTIGDEQQYHIYGKNDFINNTKTYVNTAYKSSRLYTTNDPAPTYVTSTQASDILTNEPFKGTFALEKWDADDNTNDPQGDSGSLKARFQLINMSTYSVVVDVNRDGILNTSNEEFAKNAVIMEFETDDEGRYIDETERFLPYGTYKIKEISPATGYLNSTIRGGRTEVTFTIRSDKEFFIIGSDDFKTAATAVHPNLTVHHEKNTTIEDPIMRGKIKIKKNDADSKAHKYTKLTGYPFSNDYESKYAQGDATLQGAVYHIYNKSKNYVYVDTNNNGQYDNGEKYAKDDTRPVYVLTTDENGFAETPEKCLPYGTYDVVEVDPSTGYLIEATRRTVTVEEGYDREGVTKQTRSIREEGQLIDLTYDSNLVIDDQIKTRLEDNSFFEVVIRGGFEFDKRDEETGKTVPLGGANLEGTYNVINRSNSYVWVDTNEDGTYQDTECYVPGEVVFTFKTDKHTGYYKSRDDLLPYGTYEIVEIDPPEGYLMLSDKNPTLNLTFTVREEGTVYDEKNKIFNYAVRGDIYFDKRNDDDAKSMGFIPFKITSLDQDGNEIESHIVFTDTNGYFNSSQSYAQHTYNTNLGDYVYKVYEKVYEETGKYPDEMIADYYKTNGHLPDMHTWMETLGITVEDLVEAGASEEDITITTDGNMFPFGTWFGVDTTPSNDLRLDATGAFPYGHYKIEELPCAGNEGYVLYKNAFEITYDASSRQTRTQAIDPHGWYNGEDTANIIDLGTIYNYPEVTLSTTALVQDLEAHYCMPYDEMVIVDTIFFHDIPKDYYEKQGYRFKVVGQLMYADTAEAEPVLDENGEPITNEIEFQYLAQEDNKLMEFDLDATGMEGRTLVVYETLYMQEGDEWIPIGKHTEKDDANQQIHFPKIETKLTGDKSEYHLVKPEKGVEVTDKVIYENLEVGKKYTLKAYLMDVDTKEVAKDDDGNEIKATNVKFTPTEPNGEAEIKFTFDAETLGEKTFVSFVEISRNRNTMALKTDFDDIDEMIKFPVIGTKALDLETGTQMSFADDSITVVDTVEYKNVFAGDELTFTGTLINKETGNPLQVNGADVTATATTVAEAGEGTCDVTFTFDGTGLEGTTLIAYESMLVPNGTEVAEHKDLEDEAQTIYIPKIGTTAVDKESKLHMSDYGQITITDTVKYENVIPSLDYKVTGQLLDKETQSVVATGEAMFKPEESTGTVDVEFTFDGKDFEGKTVVAYEDLYVVTDNGDKIVARHADINDEEQAVHIPKVRTLALDKTTCMHITKAGQATVIDTVSYENVITGVEYTVSGKLVDKTTGEVVKGADGKEVTASTKFTPDETSGTIEVTYDFDASNLEGTTLVAYEYLKVGEYQVGHHEDIEDEEQTIYIPKIRTTAIDSETEDHIANADELITIIDTVKYENVLPGHTYTMTGYLVDKETGEEITLLTEEEVEEIQRRMDGETSDDPMDEQSRNKYYEVLKAKDGTIYYHVLMDIIVDETTRIVVGYYKEVDDKFVECNPDGSDKTDGEEYDTIINKIIQEGNRVSITFVAEGTEGTVELPFNISGTALKGKSVVAFEEMFLGEFSVAEHKDLSDEGQTVVMPELHTTALDKISSTHYVEADGTVTVVDTVAYKNVLAGKEYTVKGELYNKETGEKAAVLAETTFTAEGTEGTIDIEFTFDGDSFVGGTYVAFEELYYNDKLVGEHKDINDEEQTVHVIRISTTAIDNDTKVNVAKNGKITITDTVSYEGLVPGENYVMSGILMKKVADTSDDEATATDAQEGIINSNQPPTTETDGNETDSVATGSDAEEEVNKVTYKAVALERDTSIIEDIAGASKNYIGEKAFTPTEANGTVDITFEIDVTDLDGESIVVFEKLYFEDKQIAHHEDIEDEAQTIHVPKIGTTATDAKTVEHIAEYSETATITDKVAYENLVPGLEYTVKGELYDKETKESIGVTAEKVFTPETADGTVDVEFTLDTTVIEGKTFVAYEWLYVNEVEVADHTDINDEAQTIKVVKVRTNATGDEGTHYVEADGTKTITDKVTYSNLIIGKEYTVKGTLYDKATSEPVLQDEGQPYTAETTFTAEAESGEVDIVFTVDAVKLAGKHVVAFEDVYYNDVKVGSHADITDKDQTIYVIKIGTKAIDENTTINVAKNGKTVIVDTVTYEGLVPGETYVMSGKLMNKATGEALTQGKDSNVIETLINGITGKSNEYISETAFVPEEPNGTVELKFEVDTTDLKNNSIVVFEKLYFEDKNIAKHEDINDDDQTVHVPEIGTRLTDKTNANKDVTVGENVVLVDTVSYKNLVPGKTYRMEGKLMNKEDGTVIDIIGSTTSNGSNSTTESTTEANSDNRELDVNEDKVEYVVGKDIKAGYYKISAKTDSNGNTFGYWCIYYSKDGSVPTQRTVDTTLTNGIVTKGSDYIRVSDNMILQLANNAYYEEADKDTAEANLIYAVKQYYKSLEETENKTETTDTKSETSGKKSIDVTSTTTDKSVAKTEVKDNTVYVEFTPTEADGSIEIEFTVNTTKLYRKHIVAFEKLFYEKTEIAVHEEIEDTEQTVFVPDQSKIGTVATDKTTGTHMTTYGDKVVIVDTVNYENLVPGTEYTLKGSLMQKAADSTDKTADKNSTDTDSKTDKTTDTSKNTDSKKTETKISDKAVAEATTKFTPDKANGSVTIEFTVDTTKLADTDLVAFEELYIKDELVAEHKDLEDESQTVHNAGLKTTATVDGKHDAEPNTKTELIDKVEYSNLVPGQEYIVKGVLMDKSTKKAITVDKNEVTAETKFTPDKSSGYVELKFNFDSTNYSEVVVFEDLYIKDVKIATHSDIDDANQTVTFKKSTPPETSTPPDTVQTGEALLGIMLSILATLLFAAVAIVLMRKRKLRFK